MAAERGTAPWLRLFRLWRLYAELDFIWMTRDSRSFLAWAVSDMLTYAASLAASLLLAQRFDGIGRWSADQVLFLVGYGLLAGGLLETFFGYNVLFISRRVGRGQLDHVLVQPQPLWMALLTEGFAPFSAAASWLPGVALTTWATTRLQLASPAWLALLALQLAASAGVVFALSYLWSCLAFWAPRGAEEISTSVMHLVEQFRMFPLDGLSSPLLGGLMTVMPLGFVAWYPSRVLLGMDPQPQAAWITPAAALALGSLSLFCFRRGLREYARTGSSRYDRLGHRG